MFERVARNAGVIALAALLLLTAIAWWRIERSEPQSSAETFVREPQRIMGTECRLIAVRGHGEAAAANDALAAAEAELRRLEALMSSWIDSSELSRLNAAPAGRAVPLSRDTLAVIRAAKQAHADTGGAFDAACRPLIELWREAGKKNRLPAAAEVEAARAASSWSDFDIGEDHVSKSTATAQLDLGGIAKGYAIDAALRVLQAKGCLGGLVEVGGDLSCFGTPPGKQAWTVQVRNPFAGDEHSTGARLPESVLALPSGYAVCTSGDYARFIALEGRRYSHIIDPRTGRPASVSASVTVIAKSALEADIWATALSVVPFEGWDDRLPSGIHAMGSRKAGQELEHEMTPGFSRFRAP